MQLSPDQANMLVEKPPGIASDQTGQLKRLARHFCCICLRHGSPPHRPMIAMGDQVRHRLQRDLLLVDDARLPEAGPDSAVLDLLDLAGDEDEALLPATLLFDADSEAEAFGRDAFAWDVLETRDADGWAEDSPLLARGFAFDEEAPCLVAVFAVRDPDFEEEEPLTLRRALAPASLTASAPSETASPIDFTT